MSAKLILQRKTVYDDGAIREMVIWDVPESVLASEHHYIYRLYDGKDGNRLVGYDNERGKGDHKHIGNDEFLYTFVSVRQFVEDFLNDILEVRNHGT